MSPSIDIIGLTETRLSSAFNDNELHIPCFRLFRKDRDEFGGGVAFYVKDCLKFTRCCDFFSVAVESIGIKVYLKDTCYKICFIYRPASAKVDFWTALEHSWDRMSCLETIVVSDFNADALALSNAAWKHLLNLTSSHGLHNYITEPTRITPCSKSCLDLLFSTPDLIPASTSVIETYCSDHCLIVGEFDVCVPATPAKLSCYRDWHRFDIASFVDMLRHSDLDVFNPTSNIWSEWYSKFMHALDICAPLKKA